MTEPNNFKDEEVLKAERGQPATIDPTQHKHSRFQELMTNPFTEAAMNNTCSKSDDDIATHQQQQPDVDNINTVPPADDQQPMDIITISQPVADSEIQAAVEKNEQYKAPFDPPALEQQPSENNVIPETPGGSGSDSTVIYQQVCTECDWDDIVPSSADQQPTKSTASFPPVDEQSTQPDDDINSVQKVQATVENKNTVQYKAPIDHPPSSTEKLPLGNHVTVVRTGKSPVVCQQQVTDNVSSMSVDRVAVSHSPTDEQPSNIITSNQPAFDPVQKDVQCHLAITAPSNNSSAEAVKAVGHLINRRHRITKVSHRESTPSQSNTENQFGWEMIKLIIVFCLKVFGSIVLEIMQSLAVLSYLGFFKNEAPSVVSDQQLLSNAQKSNNTSVTTDGDASENHSAISTGCGQDYFTESFQCTGDHNAVHKPSATSAHLQRHLETSDEVSTVLEIPSESTLKTSQPLSFADDPVVKILPDQKKVESVSGEKQLTTNKQAMFVVAVVGLEYGSHLNEDLSDSALPIAAVDNDKKKDKEQSDGQADSITTQAIMFQEETRPTLEELCTGNENPSVNGTNTYLGSLDNASQSQQIPEEAMPVQGKICIGDENISIDDVTYLDDSFEQSNADSMLIVVSTARPVERAMEDDYCYLTKGKLEMFVTEPNDC